MIEQTMILLKPDAVARGLVGEITTRFEKAGFKIVGMKMVHVNEEMAKKHYSAKLIPIIGKKTTEDYSELGIECDLSPEDLGKKAYADLIKYATESPLIAVVLEGVHAVKMVRKMVGVTSPHRSAPGTIRADYSTISMGYATFVGMGGRNLIHASGSLEEAKEEIQLWFKKEEIMSYENVNDKHTRR